MIFFFFFFEKGSSFYQTFGEILDLKTKSRINLRGGVLPLIPISVWMPPHPPSPPPVLCAVVGDCGLPRCPRQVSRSSARVSQIKLLREKSMLVKLSHLLLNAEWNRRFSYSLGYFLLLDRLPFFLLVFDVVCREKWLWTLREAFRDPSLGPREWS